MEKEPGNINGYIGLGSSLLLQDRFAEAKEAYQEALIISPDSVEALIGLGSTFYMLDKYADASDFYSKALEINEENPNAHWGLAINLYMMGKKEDALEHLERVVELVPNSSLANDAENMINDIHLEFDGAWSPTMPPA